MKRLGMLIAIALLLMRPAAAPAQVKAEVSLRAAIEKETVQGDLRGAIEQYKKIVATYASHRAVAAQALLHMGQCYEKLGESEAQKAYERVVREYADQKDASEAARARLARNGAPRQGGTVVRQLWSGNDVDLYGKPSPDGRYLAFVDWKSSTGNVAVRDLHSGENRILTHETSGHVDTLVFSPDGKQIAYTWDDKDVRLIGADGSRMRVLTAEGTPWVCAWSADGKQLAAIVRKRTGEQSTFAVATISTPDGAVTTLKSTGFRYPEIGSFSADGRFLVYAVPHGASAADGGIFTIPVAGGPETALVQGPAINGKPAWTPDGRAVVFTSDRSGTIDLWSIRVADGKPQGAPELVRANTGDIVNLGFARDGSFFYGVQDRQSDVYIADLDPETLSAASPPTRLTEKLVGANGGAAWSPDGKLIAFLKGRDRRAMSLVIRSISTGEERTLPTRIADSFFDDQLGLAWFPDSHSVLISDTLENRRVFRRVNVETGEDRVIFEGAAIYPPVAKLSPDGKSLYYGVSARSESGPRRLMRIMKRDLETGRDTLLAETRIGLILAVSPDGGRLMFAPNHEEGGQRPVMTLSTNGGTPREIYRGDEHHPAAWLGGWTKDSRYVLTAFKDEGKGSRLFAIPADGGQPRELRIPMPMMNDLRAPTFSPDGRRLAFTGIRNKGELWVIHNLMPGLRPAKPL